MAASQVYMVDRLSSLLPDMVASQWDTAALQARVVTAVHSRHQLLNGASLPLKDLGKVALVATKAKSSSEFTGSLTSFDYVLGGGVWSGAGFRLLVSSSLRFNSVLTQLNQFIG
jgi:hypothetical protein